MEEYIDVFVEGFFATPSRTAQHVDMLPSEGRALAGVSERAHL